MPISDELCLVTSGKTLATLDTIERRTYAMDGDRVLVSPEGVEVVTGNYLRLGGLFDGDLIYSEGRGQHQPFQHRGLMYYTDDEPRQRIYCDGRVVVDHHGEFLQVTNPCVTDSGVYFEARTTDDARRPDEWSIWFVGHEGSDWRLIGRGANPAVYHDHLFFGEWNGRNFDYCRAKAD